MGYYELIIRSYDAQFDRARVEDLERRCEVGPSERVFLFTDTMGDPICRIRNSPLYKMLVAEVDNELVGVIQGSIKVVMVHKPFKDLAKVGYILGLRVTPLHRRKGIGLSLVHKLEEWFVANDVDYAYMATEKDNEASVKLFNKLGYVKFRSPAILVNPVNYNRLFHLPSNIEIAKVKIEEAEFLYRKFMASSTEFFPADINNILMNKLSLGTWVAYFKGDHHHHQSWGSDDRDSFGSSNDNNNNNNNTSNGHTRQVPKSWAMVSVWNSGEIFKLRLGKAPLSCLIFTKSSRLIERFFPCFKVPAIPDFFSPFGFYFIYGVHREGPFSGKLVKALCQFVHNMAATTKSNDCKVIVTEVGGYDSLRYHIPHWKLLSCPEDLWCIKDLKSEEGQEEGKRNSLHELTTTTTTNTRALFVDPREV